MAQDALTNEAAISVNADAIAVNGANIATNSLRLNQAFGQIDAKSAAILENSEEIRDISSGLAAVAALPDLYLSPGAKWSASGGAAVYGDDFGFGATIGIRGSENWAFGASAATGGERVTGKVQVRYEGF